MVVINVFTPLSQVRHKLFRVSENSPLPTSITPMCPLPNWQQIGQEILEIVDCSYCCRAEGAPVYTKMALAERRCTEVRETV